LKLESCYPVKNNNKHKGGTKMFNDLQGLGLGLVFFALIIGVGSVVLFNFGNAAGGTANTNVQYLLGQLGSSGLAGWTPAIIAISIGMLFIGGFLMKGGKKGRR
jgi:hypothetical protein